MVPSKQVNFININIGNDCRRAVNNNYCLQFPGVSLRLYAYHLPPSGLNDATLPSQNNQIIFNTPTVGTALLLNGDGTNH
jgi:hypothetical protein